MSSPAKNNSLLGKPVPGRNLVSSKRRGKFQVALIGVIGSSLVLLGLGSLTASIGLNTASSTQGSALANVRVLGAPPATTGTTGTTGTGTTGTTTTTTPSTDTVLHPCDRVDLGTAIFPLLPPSILDNSGCYPAVWNLHVIQGLAAKVLKLLNWIALVAAIIFTVYAGVLYISGFASEGNVKTAKSILIACYVGLFIVFAARIILFGTVSLLNDSPTPSQLQGTDLFQSN